MAEQTADPASPQPDAARGGTASPFCAGPICANCCLCRHCGRKVGTRHLDVCACPPGTLHDLCPACSLERAVGVLSAEPPEQPEPAQPDAAHGETEPCFTPEQQRMAEIRRMLRMTQAEFGAMLGVSRVTVANWERGIYQPRIRVRDRAEGALITRRTRNTRPPAIERLPAPPSAGDAENFEAWASAYDQREYVSPGGFVSARAAWDHQQKRLDAAQRQHAAAPQPAETVTWEDWRAWRFRADGPGFGDATPLALMHEAFEGGKVAARSDAEAVSREALETICDELGEALETIKQRDAALEAARAEAAQLTGERDTWQQRARKAEATIRVYVNRAIWDRVDEPNVAGWMWMGEGEPWQLGDDTLAATPPAAPPAEQEAAPGRTLANVYLLECRRCGKPFGEHEWGYHGDGPFDGLVCPNQPPPAEQESVRHLDPTQPCATCGHLRVDHDLHSWTRACQECACIGWSVQPPPAEDALREDG